MNSLEEKVQYQYKKITINIFSQWMGKKYFIKNKSSVRKEAIEKFHLSTLLKHDEQEIGVLQTHEKLHVNS